MAKKKAPKARKRDMPAFDGERLRAALDHRGFSNRDAAKVMDVSDGLISHLKHNKRRGTERDITTAFLLRIYRMLNPPSSVDVITLEYLCGLDEKMTRRR